MRILWPLLCLILCSCGETRAQRQQLAQARTDLEAAQWIHAQDTGDRTQIADLMAAAMDRLDAFILGTQMDLPEPITPIGPLTTRPDAIAQERQAAGQAKADPPRGGWSAVWLWLTGAGAVAFAVARQIAPRLGPIGALWGKAADSLWALLAHRGQRRQEDMAARALRAAPILTVWAQAVCQDDILSAMLTPEQVDTLMDLALWDIQAEEYPKTVPT